MNSRGVAADILAGWLETGEFPSRRLEKVRQDRAFITEMVQGAVRWKALLDWVLTRTVRREPSPVHKAFLWTGLYQILLMDDVEAYAAVNETVEAAKAVLSRKDADFINAVLRGAVREKETIRTLLKEQPLPIRLSHPVELIGRWLRQFGQARMVRICQWNNERPGVVIRVNRLKTSLAALAGRWAGAGIQASPHPAAPEECLTLSRGVSVSGLPGYAEGEFLVIDPSVLRSVALLDPRAGERILDGCAAPGGKTFLIAERLAGRGTLTAMDASADRLDRLRDNLKRLGCDGVEVIHGDMTKAPPSLAPFDRILLDVPCTNTGVIRRRPDARWRFSERDMRKNIGQQKAMLNGAVPLLKPGGTLVYSTCSLEPEEDEQLVAEWVREHPGFSLKAEEKIVPGETGTDGAYVARIERAPR
ncbi:MAG: 16S rRNA (cytosine(967)-C(5))-methyltransferase RsmB [Lentisphaerae bacterium]|nr:16S rRNA (cytosine(967)-C(5))-methyltransferase RsmB [Lentisphaerota bacterium]